MSIRPLSWAVLGFLAVCTPVPAMAQENMFWRSLAGGNFNDATNWSEFQGETNPWTLPDPCPDPANPSISCVPEALPDPTRRAVFDIGGSYGVFLNGGATMYELQIRSGGVFFNLNGNTLSTTGPGLLASNGSATFSNGSLFTNTITVNSATMTLSNVQGTTFQLDVASQGTGILNLTNGTSFFTGGAEANIGLNAGANGFVNVTGSSQWNIGGVLNIGTGAVTVGADSRLTAGAVNVGTQNGSGTLNIINSGRVTSVEGSVGSGCCSNGFVNITGGSAWDVTFALHIGDNSGTGAVTVGADSRLTAGAVTIGSDHSFGSGTVTIGNGGLVEAQGIQVQTTGTLDVSTFDATLRAQSINVNGGGTAIFTGQVVVGTVTVDGAGSRIVQNGLPGNVLISDTAGLGILNIRNGGQYFGAPSIGHNATNGGLGLVTVEGNNSRWVIGGVYFIGAGAGLGQALVQQGGFASSGDLAVGGRGLGNLTVDGDGSRWSSSGSVHVGGTAALGAGAAGTITLSNGGSMDVAGILKVWGPGEVQISGGAGLTAGAIDISGGKLINNSGSINSSGLLSVSGGGLYSSNGTVFAGNGGFSAITITGAQSLLQADKVQIGNGASLNLLNGGRVDGHIQLDGGQINRPAGLTLNAQRSVEGYGLINANVQVASAGELVAHGGTLTVNGTVIGLGGGLIGLDYATLTANSLTIFGDLVGTGTIATTDGVTMHGHLNAGFPDFVLDSNHTSIGTMTFLSDITFGSDSITEFDIGGLNWDDYDHIVVKGTATFGGTLLLNFINGFTLNGPASFSLFVDDFLGSFDSVIIHGLEPGFTFSLAGGNTGLSLLLESGAPVPEPATVWLFLTGAATLLAYRRWQAVRLTAKRNSPASLIHSA